ncbi:MAG: erythromycin esterase family protein [Saprospiraceae bacterium]|nr:erythromycin esterase family protein [Saprospiraceae bacterium]
MGPNTTASLDSTTAYSGNFSLRIFNENAADDGSGGDHTLGYWLSPYELQGRKLSLTGWVKSEKSGGTVQISLGAYGEMGLLSQAQSADIQGINDWKQIKLELQVDSSTHSYFLIVGANGGGKAWFDDFRLTVNGEEKHSLEVATDFTPEQRAWLQKNSSAMARVEPTLLVEKADYSDLEEFRRSVGDAEIIALGEATHGTSEFFLLKHRLLQFAVQELGVRVFAIEANQLEVEKINRFVTDGVGTAEGVIRVMFKVWNTAEMLALIQWMRAYNLAHPGDKVEFVGFDLQDPSLPMDSLSQFFADWEPSQRPLVDSLQHTYRAAWQAQYYPQAPDEVRANWKKNADEVLAICNQNKDKWLRKAASKTEQNRVKWALQNARLVSQAARYCLFANRECQGYFYG